MDRCPAKGPHMEAKTSQNELNTYGLYSWLNYISTDSFPTLKYCLVVFLILKRGEIGFTLAATPVNHTHLWTQPSFWSQWNTCEVLILNLAQLWCYSADTVFRQTDGPTDTPNTWLNTPKCFCGSSCYNRCPGPHFAMMTHTHTFLKFDVVDSFVCTLCVVALGKADDKRECGNSCCARCSSVADKCCCGQCAPDAQGYARGNDVQPDIFVKWLENENVVTENTAQRILPLWKIITLQHRMCLNVFQIQQLYSEFDSATNFSVLSIIPLTFSGIIYRCNRWLQVTEKYY